jgi:hypothetical protein
MTFHPVFEDDLPSQPLDEWEESLVTKRQHLFDIVQNRCCSFDARENNIFGIVPGLSKKSILLSWDKVRRKLLSLERMSNEWDGLLMTAEGVPSQEPEKETIFEQFLVYLMFRHLGNASDEFDFETRAIFCAFCSHIFRVVTNGKNLEETLECARLFSQEIEYAEENTEALLDMIDEIRMGGEAI